MGWFLMETIIRKMQYLEVAFRARQGQGLSRLGRMSLCFIGRAEDFLAMRTPRVS